ncbi:MAG: DUF86 domain-containing protein [Spirochaetaceae bacterium]|nr:DUF86 domain-containing protein [Spirochaetaceae bacterium]
MELALSFTSGISLNEFKQDEKTQYAVIRCLEVIGEAVKRIPEVFRERYPSIPWKAMAGMRDRLIHGYDVVDNEIVWITVRKTIPGIIEEFSRLPND